MKSLILFLFLKDTFQHPFALISYNKIMKMYLIIEKLLHRHTVIPLLIFMTLHIYSDLPCFFLIIQIFSDYLCVFKHAPDMTDDVNPLIRRSAGHLNSFIHKLKVFCCL